LKVATSVNSESLQHYPHTVQLNPKSQS